MKQLLEVVYGVQADELVFIPVDRARYLAQTWEAMVRAKTWGDLKKLAPRKAYCDILKFQDDPRSLRSHHEFDYYTMTPVPGGDYPGFPKQEVMAWMPEAVWRRYGDMVSTVLNGDYPAFATKDLRAIVAELNQLGIHCRKDQRLVDAAHGD